MRYRYHRANSRKGYVHMMYDLFGREVATDVAIKFGIKESSYTAWMGRWDRWEDLRLDRRPR